MEKETEPIKRPIPIDKEVVWDKKLTIMSKTDLFGSIEYANEVFIDVSGYEDHELMTKPQNIVRHPDMPKIIYQVLWENIKKGNEFHGIVKNLAKSGRYYWAITDFEYPRDENGNITNYIARRKSVPQDVITKHIDPLYKKLLQIEKVSGVKACENYLTGFLEEMGLTYVEYITKIMMESEENDFPKENVKKEIESKGIFRRFFDK